MGIANAASTFYTAATKAWLISAGAILILEIARPFSGDGYTFNLLILFITLALFYYVACRVPHQFASKTQPKTHFVGGLVCLTAWSVTFAALSTLSSLVALKRELVYLGTDPFFVTDISPGAAPYTSVTPFVASMESSNLVLTFAVHLTCLAAIAALGLFLGTFQASKLPHRF